MSLRRYSRELVVLLLLFGITALVFGKAVSAGFVSWDDDILITKNPHLQGLNLQSLVWMFNGDTTLRFQPLTWFTCFFVYDLAGKDPHAFHLANLIWHGLNTGVLYLFLRQLFLAAATPPLATRHENYLSFCAAMGALA